MAAEKGVTEHLTRELAAYAWSTAAFWLNALGYSYAGIRSYSIPSCVSATGLFGFDADKAMYACLVVDDLSNYDQAAVFGAQPDRDTWETVGPHLRETSIAIKTSDSPPSTILCLLLHFGIGRSNAIRGPARNEMIDYELLMMSVSELESVAILHAPDELLFWRFAQDLNDLHKRTHVFSTDLLNLFGFYRSRDYCFYLSDEAVPTALLLGSDWEGDLRREAFNKTDIHAARAPGGNGFVDVALLHARRSIPVYVPVGDIGHRSAVVVECYSIPVWILDGTPEETDRLQNRGVLNLISDSIAFWLWQVSPSFREWFDATLGQEQLLLAIELRAKEPLDPNLSSDADDVSDTSFFVVEPIFEEQCIRCELHP
ncbi:MAG: hypothetical protein A49_14770 [Methyloceanibacter sp.]|nr:MAG: hypothetical protein A49_14770 [Methyloceanibacter sp.]